MDNHLGGGPRLFSTIRGESQLNESSKSLANADPALTTLMNKHGARKFWAAVKAQGLEPEDIDRNAAKDVVKVHEKVPAASVPAITAGRQKIWEELRQQRLRQVETCMDEMKDDDVRRYWKCESGVNPIGAKDLPPVDTLGGMDKFNEMQAQMQHKIKEEQRRKANALGMNFLLEKKKREEADAKMAAFEKRVADYKREQAEEWKQKSIASQKKAEKRKQDADRAAQARAEWEDETEAALWNRFTGARARRNHMYSPEGLAAKLEANKQKRIAAFQQATEMEEALLESLENRRISCEERLEARNQEVRARLAQQAADSKAAFQHKQVVIHAKTTEWVEQKLSDHEAYQGKVGKARADYQSMMKEKSKSCSDIRRKATDKVNQNKAKLKGESDQANEDLMMRHALADKRREELNAMKFKNENDIFTFREMKHHTFGELTNRRNTEIKKRTNAQHQQAIIYLAEKKLKGQAEVHAKNNLRKCRQETNKEALTLTDKAAEGFLKIQSEPDEAKVIATMNAMGFDMPKLPEKDEDGDEEAPAKGF